MERTVAELKAKLPKLSQSDEYLDSTTDYASGQQPAPDIPPLPVPPLATVAAEVDAQAALLTQAMEANMIMSPKTRGALLRFRDIVGKLLQELKDFDQGMVDNLGDHVHTNSEIRDAIKGGVPSADDCTP